VAEITKYEVLINDLTAIETQLSSLAHKNQELYTKNIELEVQIKQLKSENGFLTQKISKMDVQIQSQKADVETSLFNSLNLKERENLKVRLQNLISKIEYHLSVTLPETKAERQA